MEFRILGPLEVSDAGKRLPLGGGKPRALLAVLAFQANDTVSSDRLIAELWGERTPRSAAKLIQGYVSDLRKSLGAAIETRPPGYRLCVEDDEFDLPTFLNLADKARCAVRRNEPQRAAGLFADALALWRGAPLADVELHGPAAVEADRLAELRLGVLLDRIDVDLTLGRHTELLGDLDVLVGEYPLQERLRGQHMLALYRSGRQADALRVFSQIRTLLIEELGLEPNEALQGLQAAILRHDPKIDPPALIAASDSTVDRTDHRTQSPSREERRYVTIIVADIAVEESEHDEDPESARTTRSAAITRLEHEVRRHGGLVEHVVGDRMLAHFGIPHTHEDDVDRAVRAALSALDSVAELSEAAPTRVVVRIAVEAGDVLVADGGAGDRRLAGALIGTVERLHAAARPGRVVVGPCARAASSDTVDYCPLRSGRGRGQVWEVSKLRASGPAERRPLSLKARLVGRQSELALLRQEVELTRSGTKARLVTILGTAGVGKSRLAHELIGYVGSLTPPPVVRRGRSLAYGNVSYSALADAVKAECGILADDPPEFVLDKVTRTVDRLFGDSSAAGQVETLVGAGQVGFSREELFDVWRRLLERMAAGAPLVLVLEDLHWADDGLLDFIDHVTEWAEAPLLVIAVARPDLLDRRPAWGTGQCDARLMTLEPLSASEMETLVTELLDADPAPDLARVLVERSGGNPLFGEEILRMLIEQGVLCAIDTGGWKLTSELGDVEVPRSIQAVIGARLDALPLDEIDVVQAAATVGRVFWVGAVQRLCRRNRRDTRELLGRLRAREIIVAHESSEFSDEPELAFRHVLIRDVAYASLPKGRRADAHVEMAGWAMEHAVGREDQIAELLATHYVHALNYRKQLGDTDRNGIRRFGPIQPEAYHWARAAGERAYRLWQQKEASRWFREALHAAAGIDVTPDDRASLCERYAHSSEGVEPYADVAVAYEAALSAYEAIGDDASAGRMEAWRAFVGFQSGDDDAVVGWSTRALTHLEPRGESRDLALALIILGSAHRRSGRFDEAKPGLRRAAAIAATLDDSVIKAQASASLGKCLQQSGNVHEGMPLLEHSLTLARAAGDLPVLLRTLVDLSEAHEEATGDYHRAQDLMREGLTLARRAGHRQQVAWMEGNLADYLLDVGRIDEAEPLSRSGLAGARHVGEIRRIALTLPTMCYLALLRGRLGEAEQLLDELREATAQVREVYASCWVPLLGGLLALARGHDDAAADILLDGARRQAGRTEIWGAVNLLAETVRCLVRGGRCDDAQDARRQLNELAAWSVPATAFLRWVDGLLEPEPGPRLAQLRDAVSMFERLERRLELGRCLADVAQTEARAGRDPTAASRRAREVMQQCGAKFILADVAVG